MARLLWVPRDESWSQSSSDHRFLCSMAPNQLIGAGRFGGRRPPYELLIGVLGVLEMPGKEESRRQMPKVEIARVRVVLLNADPGRIGTWR